MDKGELITDAPIFDYFFLESFDKKKYWEWMLADVHKFIGEGSQISGWLVSEKLKEVLGQFRLAEPHCYYASKLLYKGEKLNYYIFQISGDSFLLSLVDYINFDKSLFWDPNQNVNFRIADMKDLIYNTRKISKDSGHKVISIPLKKLVLKKAVDFYPMQSFLQDNLVSERLKQAIEDNGITGFEFSELDYEVVVEKG